MLNTLILKGVLFTVLLFIATAWDIRKREIPDRIPLLIFLTGFWGIKPDAFLGLALTGLPYLAAAVLPSKKGLHMGGGDIKLMAACGFVLGVWGGILQSIAALTFALLVGLGIRVCRSDKKLDTIRLPLAPFFCVGGVISYGLLFIY